MRFLLLVVLPLWLLATDLVAPGDSSLDSSFIRGGTDSLVVVLVQGDQVGFAGTFMVLETQTDKNGVLSRKERLVGLDGAEVSADSFALDLRTLAPTYRIVAGQERTTAGEAFHPNSIDIVIAALPLVEGYAAELALENEGTDLAPTAQVRVRGVEDIPLPSGEVCSTWRVDVLIGEKRGLYLIDQQSRKLVRYFSRQDGVMLNRIRGCGV